MNKKMRNRSGFNPLDKYVVVNTAEGFPKYEPKTVNGLPVYNDEDKMIMVPVLKIKPEAMIEWLYTEYPNAQTEFIRHTEKPFEKMDGSVYYPQEVFECRLWLDGKRGDFDTNAFASRENIPGDEFNPIAAAQTSALLKAMKNLGFACDISDEEVYSSLGMQPVFSLGKTAGFDVYTESIGDGVNIEIGRNGEILDNDLIESIVEKVKHNAKRIEKIDDESVKTTSIEEKAEEPIEETPKKEEKEETVKEEPIKKKKRGRPRKTPEKGENEPVTKEKAANDVIPDVFKTTPELEAIAGMKFVAEDTAPETMRKHEGETFADIYENNFGLLKVIGSPTFNFKGKVSEDIHNIATKIMEVSTR